MLLMSLSQNNPSPFHARVYVRSTFVSDLGRATIVQLSLLSSTGEAVESEPSPTSLDTNEHPAPQLTQLTDPDWMYEYRDRVADALAGFTLTEHSFPKRVRALQDCGRAALLVTCGNCKVQRLVPYRCGARTCPACSRRVVAGICDRIAARVSVHDLIMEGEPWDGPGASKQRRSWRHVVLTSKTPLTTNEKFDPALLRDRVLRVRQAASKFWRNTAWGAQVRDRETGRKRSRRDTSYVLGQEIAPGGMVHIHLLVYGEYIPQAVLQGAWSSALGQRAIVYVTTVDGNGGVAKVTREALKYATKGEKGTRDEARHAAAVEVAFRRVKRLSIGGALRTIKIDDATATTDDAKPEDLTDDRRLVCESCGSVGRWIREGWISPKVVVANGGYGPYGTDPPDEAKLAMSDKSNVVSYS